MIRQTRRGNAIAIFTIPWLLAVTFLISIRAYAQVAGGTLTGSVTDSSGLVIPGAEVSIKNIATGLTRDVTTDAAGFYTAPNLLPGTYDVSATALGFATELRTGITLTVGAQQVLNLTLRVGAVTEKVEVAGQAPTVQLATSTISAVVNSTTVRELPLNGRSWTDLATLQPGVTAIQTQASFSVGADRGNRGFGAEVAVAGSRPEQSNYRLDGVSINDMHNSAPGSILGGDLGVDAIEEFSVLTSNYSAEYGRSSGGVVNAITRSGTNQFHGGVYEFLRNSSLDARNFFDYTSPNRLPSFRRNQFGAEAGGPIRKDKLFVFGDYEGIRQSLGISTPVFVPSAAVRNGVLCSLCPTQDLIKNDPASLNDTPTNGGPGVDPATGIDLSVKKYLPFWPLASRINPGDSTGDTGLFDVVGQQVINENFFTTRVDDKISEKDSLAGTYLIDFTPYSSPDGLNNVLVNSETHRQIVTLEETHTFSPTLVNSARLGFSRDYVLNDAGIAAINPLAKDPSLAAIPGQFAAHVQVPGFLSLFTGGVKGNSYYIYGWNSFQGYDDAFWTYGTHSIKFGGAAERMQSNRFDATDPSGVFNFPSLKDFLTNQPNKFTGESASSLSPQGLRQSLFGLYLQDDWRFRPNLTLNIGLRWEMTTVISEAQGKIVNLYSIFDPLPRCGKFISGSCAPGSPFPSNSTLRNFEPRVGFAWDPFHNGKTAVRGGFGIFDVLPLPYQYFSATNIAPFAVTGSANSLPPYAFYTGGFPALLPTTKGGDIFEPNSHRSYVLQWNLNVQRQLPGNLTALVGYVGSRGVHEPFRVDDLDIVLPTKTSQGYLYLPADNTNSSTLNPNFGSIVGVFYEGNSFYDALELGLQRPMSHGFQFQGSFTWGKSIDTGSATGHGDQFSNSISSLPWYDLRNLRSVSDFNIGRTLVLSGTWQLPSPKSLSGPAGWILNGWELGGIYTASDGVPFTATWGTGADPQGLLNSDDWAFPNRLTGPGCQSPVNPGNPNGYIKTQCFVVPTAPASFFFPNASPPLCSSDPQLAVLDPAFSPLGAPPQCFNLRGNSGRNVVIGPGTSNLDFSVFKNNYIRRISENFNVQFRAEVFNILNRANFHIPVVPDNADIFDGTGTPSPTAGALTSTTTTSRQIQFALKVIW
jgi:Carboxypeptidase regulatory-like domain/TonB dependent receptor-like, beta-barrel/TonB-dependent Receptor Plug Domain